jgi:hypothetical protein
MFQTTNQMMIAIMVDWWLLMITITLRIITNGDFGDGLWHCFNHIRGYHSSIITISFKGKLYYYGESIIIHQIIIIDSP